MILTENKENFGRGTLPAFFIDAVTFDDINKRSDNQSVLTSVQCGPSTTVFTDAIFAGARTHSSCSITNTFPLVWYLIGVKKVGRK